MPPVPPQLTEPVDLTVEEEAQLLLSCNIWANPQVSEVHWKVNGSNVDLEESGLMLTNDGYWTKLSTGKAERGRHEGTYQCSMTYFSKVYTQTFNVKLAGQLKVFCWKHEALPATPLPILSSFSFASVDKTLKFPLMPLIAAIVIVVLTLLLALLSRWRRIVKVTRATHMYRQMDWS